MAYRVTRKQVGNTMYLAQCAAPLARCWIRFTLRCMCAESRSATPASRFTGRASAVGCNSPPAQ